MFIPEITTRVTTKVRADSIDEAINKIESDPYLSQCSSIMETLQNKKNLSPNKKNQDLDFF